MKFAPISKVDYSFPFARHDKKCNISKHFFFAKNFESGNELTSGPIVYFRYFSAYKYLPYI
jgi:hypothetical protein